MLMLAPTSMLARSTVTRNRSEKSGSWRTPSRSPKASTGIIASSTRLRRTRSGKSAAGAVTCRRTPAVANFLLRDRLAPYAVGAILASAVWWIYTLTLESAGIVDMRAGVAAEEWTTGELRPLRRKGWRLVNHVMIGQYDLDHALLGPGGLFAVETKFRSDWSLSAPFIGEMAQQARRTARDLENRLRVWKPAARPVVVMWGPHVSAQLSDLFEQDGVTFCSGRVLREFVEAVPANLEDDAVRQAYSNLDDHVTTRDVGEIRQSGGLPRPVSQVLNEWILVTGAAWLSMLAVLAPIRFSPLGLWGIVVAAGLTVGASLARRRWPHSVRLQHVTTAIIATSAGLGCLLVVAMIFGLTS